MIITIPCSCSCSFTFTSSWHQNYKSHQNQSFSWTHSSPITTMTSTSSSEPTDWTPPEANCDKCGAPASWADEYVFPLNHSLFSLFFLWAFSHLRKIYPKHASISPSKLALETSQALNLNPTETLLIRTIQMDKEPVMVRWYHTSLGYLLCKPTYVALGVHTWQWLFASTAGATNSKLQLEGPLWGSSRTRVWEEDDQCSQ